MTEPAPLTATLCEWPVDTACFTAEWESLSEETKDRSMALAIATLRRLTGNRVGGCPVVIRPASRECVRILTPNDYLHPVSPISPRVTGSGDWVNYACGEASGRVIDLPPPVGEVYEVKIDGVVLNPSGYRVDGDAIWRIGTEWPTEQDFSLPDTEPGTFSIRYLNSYPVDEIGAYAVALMAMEYAKACAGSNKCRLPSSVTSVARQGLTFDIPTGAFPNGLTGIREVDTFIALWNPDGLRASARVWSPDMRKHHIRRSNV